MPKSKNKTPRWGKKETNKLIGLFEEGSIPTNLEGLTKNIVVAVRDKHFPGRPYDSFKKQYKRKLEEFLDNRELEGMRRNGKFTNNFSI